jgi:hypothetical protein
MLEIKARKDRDAEVRAEVQQGQSFRSLLRACRVWTYMVSAEDGKSERTRFVLGLIARSNRVSGWD